MGPRNTIILTVIGMIASTTSIIMYLKNNNINLMIIPLMFILISTWFIITGEKK